jgi:hypothetical protein
MSSSAGLVVTGPAAAEQRPPQPPATSVERA